MTTMPDCDRAIDLAGAHPGLGVGIHLCLTQGTARSGQLKYLTSADGQFPREVWRLLERISLNRKALEEARGEWAAQIEYALKRGLHPTHLDSHKHIHHWPALAAIALDLAAEHGLSGVRCANEIILPALPGLSSGYRVLRLLAKRLKRRMNRCGLCSTDSFYGLAATGRFSAEIWLRLLESLPEGTCEVMVHPGYATDLTGRQTRLTSERELELNGLCDPRVGKKVEECRIERVHFGQIRHREKIT